MIDDFKKDDGGELDFVDQQPKRRGRPITRRLERSGFNITQKELESIPGYSKPIAPKRQNQ